MYNLRFSRFGNALRGRLGKGSIPAPRGGGRFFKLIDEVPMYAVIKTGGKQYKVAAGEKLKVEQIPADIGSEITLDQVLAVGAGETIKFGTPLVQGAKVLATVVAHGRHDKVKIFKMRRRKHYQKRQGHRQNYTELHIVSING
jgi:large subunit ribosomal protein L21